MHVPSQGSLCSDGAGPLPCDPWVHLCWSLDHPPGRRWPPRLMFSSTVRWSRDVCWSFGMSGGMTGLSQSSFNSVPRFPWFCESFLDGIVPFLSIVLDLLRQYSCMSRFAALHGAYVVSGDRLIVQLNHAQGFQPLALPGICLNLKISPILFLT